MAPRQRTSERTWREWSSTGRKRRPRTFGGTGTALGGEMTALTQALAWSHDRGVALGVRSASVIGEVPGQKETVNNHTPAKGKTLNYRSAYVTFRITKWLIQEKF